MKSRMPSRGFTLIELLVVIAIVGLLASVVLFAIAPARAKGRDARRLEDLHQLLNFVALYMDPVVKFNANGCAGASGAVYKVAASCIKYQYYGPDNTQYPWNLGSFNDPVDNSWTNPCTPASTGTCNYAVHSLNASQPDTGNYEICGYLETNSGPLAGQVGTTGGLVRIDSAQSSILAGCL